MLASDLPETLLSVERAGAVATMRLNRPESRNALSPAMLVALRDSAAALATDESIRVVIVTGTGSSFAAGADLREIRAADVPGNLAYNDAILEAFASVEALPVPTIACINGHAMGGGLELALACTLRVCAEGALLGLPEVRLGLIPGAGGMRRLPRIVGAGMAWRMLLTGLPVDAIQGRDAGLVDEIAPPGQALQRATALAEQIVAAAPLAVRAILAATRPDREAGVVAAGPGTRDALREILGSADLREGIDAFFAKRPPTFTGA